MFYLYNELYLIIRTSVVVLILLLLDTIHYKGKTYPKTYYKADFKYFDNEKGKYIIEDIKSPITAKDKVYRLKIKMLLTKYPDIDFVEVIWYNYIAIINYYAEIENINTWEAYAPYEYAR